MSTSFWGNKIKEGKPVKVENDGDTLISITQASLVGGNDKKRTTLSFIVDGTEFTCCSLTSNNPQFKLDLCLEPAQEIQFSVKGPGEIHLLGYNSDLRDDGDMLANELDFDSDEEGEEGEEGEEDESEEEEEPIQQKRVNGAAPKGQPAKKQKTEEPKKEVQQQKPQQPKQQAPKTPQPQGKEQKPKTPPQAKPQTPAAKPQTPGGKPQTPGGKPQTPGGKPQTPGGKPQTPGGKPQLPGGKPQTPGGKPNQGGKKK